MRDKTKTRVFLAVVGVLCLLVGACTGDTATSVADPPVQAPELQQPPASEVTAPPDIVAIEVDAPSSMSTDERAVLVGELEAAADEWLAATTAPGVSVSIRLPNEEPINIARGISDVATGEPVTVDDYFRIASITKTMSAALALELVDEGLIELDAPVAQYLGAGWLGDYPNAGEITVAQLMNHTNGLVEFAFDIGFYRESVERLDKPYEPEEILEFLSRQDPLFAPGEKYRYETGGFVALGLVIEAVTGNTAAEEMRSRIFEPAGAQAIFLTPQEFPPDPVVRGYVRGPLFAAFKLLGADRFEETAIGDEPVFDVVAGAQAAQQSAGWTGGGNEARLESVSAIWKAMFDGTILSPAGIDAMTTTVFDSGYGLGLSVTEQQGTIVYSHGGGVPGFRSHAGYLPEHDISYAFSANLIPLPDGTDVETFAAAILPVVVAAANGSAASE